MIILKVENLTRVYDVGGVKTVAINDVSFEINQGEFLVIMGPSGSGKSTLLNLLGGIDCKAQGKVLYKDINILDKKNHILSSYRQDTVGTIFQDFNLVEESNVEYNLRLPRILSRFSQLGKEEEEIILKEFGLYDVRKTKTGNLSQGEQQRVAVTRSIINDPEIILADEPTGNLDAENGIKVIELLKKLNTEKKKTVILVTHNPDYKRYADRIIYLMDGKIDGMEIVNDKRDVAKEDVVGIFKKKEQRGLFWGRASKIARENIHREFSKYLFVSIITGFGISLIFVILNFALIFSNNLSGNAFPMQYLNIIQVREEPSIVDQAVKPLDSLGISKIESIASGNEVYPITSLNGTISFNNKSIPLYATTASPKKYFHTFNEGIQTGRFFNSDDENGIILTNSMINELKIPINSGVIGNSVTIQIDQINKDKLEAVGTYTLPIIGVLDDNIRYTNALLSYNFNGLNEPDNIYNADSVYINLNDPNNVDSIASKIEALGYDAHKAGEQIYAFNLIINTTLIIVVIMFVLGFIATISSVFSFMGIVFYKRSKEIALMKVFGPKRGRILSIYINEAILFGIEMSVIAVIFGYLETAVINAVIGNPYIQSITFQAVSFVPYGITEGTEVFVLTLIIAFILVIYPAIKASRTNILEALDRV